MGLRLKELERQMHEIESEPCMREPPIIYSSASYNKRRRLKAKLDVLLEEYLELEKSEKLRLCEAQSSERSSPNA